MNRKSRNVRIIAIVLANLILLFGGMACSRNTVEIRNTQVQQDSATITKTPTNRATGTIAVNTTTPVKEKQLNLSTEIPPDISTTTHQPIVGIEIRNFSNNKVMELINTTKTNWIRFNGVVWSDIETIEGEYDWSPIETLKQEITTANQFGYQVILIVRGTPEWAQLIPGSFCGPIKTDKFDEFANFMYQLVSKFFQSPNEINYWEMGNEPDAPFSGVGQKSPYGCWGDANSQYYGGKYYAEMLKTVYPRIKDANPEAQVMVGGLLLDCDPENPPETNQGSGVYKSCSSSRFLEGILFAGGGEFFDGISFHAYDYYQGAIGKYGNINWHSNWDTGGPVLVNKAEFLKNILDTYNATDKFLMNTETAVLCLARDISVCQTEEFNHTKAFYLAISNAAALSTGLRANIWYSLQGWRGSELVDQNFGILPAFEAYRFSSSMLTNASFYDEFESFPGVRGYQFTTNEQQIMFLWSVDGEPHEILLPNQPDDMFNVFGERLEIPPQLRITVDPLYLIWNQ